MMKRLMVAAGFGTIILGVAGYVALAENPVQQTQAVEIANDHVNAYLQAMRADLREGKTGLINEVMRLSDEEDDVFWEIYREYEEEYFALGDRRLETIRKFVDVMKAGMLDDATAVRLARESLDQNEEMVALLRKYHARISEKLSPVRAAQFLQIENRVGTVIDLVVAAQIPLIRS